MFNTFCFALNLIRLAWLAALLRRGALALLGGRQWRYLRPTAGYVGGVDVRWLGTVAFDSEDGRRLFRW